MVPIHFFGHHLCILFNNIQKLSVPVQRLQNEQQYSSSPSVVSVKSSGWCQWKFEPCLCKASMLLTNKRVKVSVWHYASTLGRYPQALKSVSWGHPHAGCLCGGCCCGWKLLWWDQLSLGRTYGGSWATGEVMQVDNFVQVPLVRNLAFVSQQI